jgi:hypothetical protein
MQQKTLNCIDFIVSFKLSQIGELRPPNRKMAPDRNMSNEGTDIHCSDANLLPNSVLPVLDRSASTVRTSNLGTSQYNLIAVHLDAIELNKIELN